jgi:hypothetical protein
MVRSPVAIADAIDNTQMRDDADHLSIARTPTGRA